MLGLALGVTDAQAQAGAADSAIEDGSKVQIEYTLTDEAGTVLDSNTGRDALTFIQEQTMVIDLNHPLAGKNLVFAVKILGVEAPAK